MHFISISRFLPQLLIDWLQNGKYTSVCDFFFTRYIHRREVKQMSIFGCWANFWVQLRHQSFCDAISAVPGSYPQNVDNFNYTTQLFSNVVAWGSLVNNQTRSGWFSLEITTSPAAPDDVQVCGMHFSVHHTYIISEILQHLCIIWLQPPLRLPLLLIGDGWELKIKGMSKRSKGQFFALFLWNWKLITKL